MSRELVSTKVASSGGQDRAAAVAAQSAANAASEAAKAAVIGKELVQSETTIGANDEDGQESDKRAALWTLKLMVPVKNLISCYLLGPVVLGECRSERLCLPWVNVVLLAVDILVFSGHLLFAMKQRSYRERILTYNFYILLVFWSMWNLCSHPLCRQYVIDVFVEPSEVHVMINVGAIAVCSSTIMAPPSVRHLIGLVTLEFSISLVLSSLEVMNFSMDSGWLAVVRLDIVMFNVAILLMGSTIIVGTMSVEKDIKNMGHCMGPSGSFEDDLERRKHAVLTALCDAVLTTSADFTVIGSDAGADRLFRTPMVNEQITAFLKDDAEKERFMTAVKKQFPEDSSVGEGPKRMRFSLRDANGETFDADVVVSDATTDQDGKVNKYMVGMHVRGDYRARALEDKAKARCGAAQQRPAEKDKAKQLEMEKEKAAGEEHTHLNLMHEELSHELLLAFVGTLKAPPPGDGLQSCAGDVGLGTTSEAFTHGVGLDPPNFHCTRATCAVFRRRAPSLAPRSGHRHVDLRRLSLPEPSGRLT